MAQKVFLSKSYSLFWLFTALVFSLILHAETLHATTRTKSCTAIIAPKRSHLLEKTFTWELTANVAHFRENPDEAVRVEFVKTNRTAVDVITLGPVDPRLLKKFVKGDDIYWPLNPNNQSEVVPFFKNVRSGMTLETRYTASRSLLYAEGDMPAFTLKAGTDHPHKSERQFEKASTKDDVAAAILRQPHIEKMDGRLPPDDRVILLPEVLVLRHKASGEGVLIRDLSRIDNENIYLPALSLPYVGRDFAAKSGKSFEAFVREDYIDPVAIVMARLLLRYGLEMETPNTQNILIEFTKDLKPTGRIVLRDTVDSNLFSSWAQALDQTELLRENEKSGIAIPNLKPSGELGYFVTWRFDEAGELAIHSPEIEELKRRHDASWINEIRLQLQIKDAALNTVEGINAFLKSSDGQKAIREYHKRLETQVAKPLKSVSRNRSEYLCAA